MTPRERLTQKEIQIAILVWEGMTNREIGRIVGTTEQVIKNHLRSAFDKLGVWSRLELAMYVASHGGKDWPEPEHVEAPYSQAVGADWQTEETSTMGAEITGTSRFLCAKVVIWDCQRLQNFSDGCRIPRSLSTPNPSESVGCIKMSAALELLCRELICRGGLNQPASLAFATPRAKPAMAYKETFWMACDSTEQLRAEYGPFLTRAEAEVEAKKLGFGYLLRYEHLLGANEEIEEVRCIFIELPGVTPPVEISPVTLHTRCATCGESAAHEAGWQAEVWADIHEFEHSRHRVRLFEHARGKGLKEIGDWRG